MFKMFIRNVRHTTGLGKVRIAAGMLGCGSETDADIDQTIFAVRVISTHVTFYKAVIRAAYWTELANS